MYGIMVSVTVAVFSTMYDTHDAEPKNNASFPSQLVTKKLINAQNRSNYFP